MRALDRSRHRMHRVEAIGFTVKADFPARRFPPPASFTLGLSPRSPRSPDPRHVFEEALTRDWQNALRDGASEGLFAVHGVDGP